MLTYPSVSTKNIINPPYYDAFYLSDEVPAGNVALPPTDFYKFLFVYEGEFCYNARGQQQYLGPGDLLMVGYSIPYSYTFFSNQKFRRVVVSFRREILNSIDPSGEMELLFNSIREQEFFSFRFDQADHNTILQLALALAKEMEYAKPFSNVMPLSLLSSLLIMLYRSASKKQDNEESSFYTKQVASIVTYINKNLLSDLSLDNIADYFFISKFHLERIFKKQMSTTVHNYIVQKRLSLARQMLYDGHSPTKIYKKCGFKEYTAFYRAFKKTYNCPPNHFLSQINVVPPDLDSYQFSALSEDPDLDSIE